MGRAVEIGTWGDAGVALRDATFGPLQRGRYGAFNDFLVDVQCLLLGTLQAGTAATGDFGLSNGWAFARGFNGCYSGAAPPYTATVTPPQFQGGQCPETYIATIERTFQNGNTGSFTSSAPHVGGPIAEFRPNPMGFGTYSVEYRQVGSNSWTPVPGGGSVSPLNPIVSVGAITLVRQDGQPDDCGSLPNGDPIWPSPVEPFPAPSPGDIIAPGRVVDIDVDIDGVIVPLSVDVGDVYYFGDNSLGVGIDSIPHRIAPDGHFDAFPDDVGLDPSKNPAETAEQDVETALEDVLEALNVSIEGDVTWVGCAGNEETAGFLGTGIAGLSAQLATIIPVVNTGVNEYCPLIEEDEPPSELASSSTIAASSVSTYSDVTVPNDIIAFSVTSSGVERPYAVGGSGTPSSDSEQGRFCQVSVGYDIEGVRAYVVAEPQYWSRGYYLVDTRLGQPQVVRVSLKPGISAVVRTYR